MSTLNRRVNIYINDRDAGKTIKTINAEATKLRNIIAKDLTPGTKEYYNAVKRLRELNGTLANHRNAINDVGNSWDGIKKQLIGFGATALAYAGFQQIFAGINNIIGSNAKLSDSYADVMKTTGMTQDEVEDLSKTFKGFNTRTSRTELLELSKVAGKLGITGVANVSKFVKAADQINVALGEDLGDIDTVVRNLGALNNVFKLDTLYGSAEAMTKVGSVINSLGAAGTARESALVDFASRVGGSAQSVGLLVDQVIAYGAVLDEAGVQSESSSTAISQFWVKMGQDATKFAGIAGMEVQAFKDLMANDFNAAFIAVLKGLQSTGGGIEELAATMGGAGVDGARMIQTLNALANNTDKLSEKQKLANQEFTKGTSLMNEFAVKNDTLAAKLERLNKWFTGNFISGGVMKAFEKLISLADDFVNVPVSKTMQDQRQEVNLLVNKLVLYNDNQEKRSEILQELNSKYPELVKQMNLENGSMQDITIALRAYNKEMVNKIALQQMDEEIKKQLEKQGSLILEQELQRDMILQKLIKAEEKLGITGRESLDLEERLAELKKSQVKFQNEEVAREERGLWTKKNLNNDILEIIREIDRQYKTGSFTTTVNDQNEKLKDQEQLLKDMYALRDRMAKRFGITMEDPDPLVLTTTTTTTTTDTPSSDAGADQQKKAEEAKIATQKLLDELAIMNIEAIADELEREMKMLEHKAMLKRREVLESKATEEAKKSMILAIDEELRRNQRELANKAYEKEKADGKKLIEEDEQERKKALQKEYNAAVATAELKILQTKEGTRERVLAEQELLRLQYEWELSNTEITAEEKLLLDAQYLKSKEQLLAEHRIRVAQQEADAAIEEQAIRDELFAKRLNEAQQYFEYAGQFANELANVFATVHDLRMQEIEEERVALEEKNAIADAARDREKAKLEEEYSNKRIRKQEFDQYSKDIDNRYNNDRAAKEAALDKKLADLEKKNARRKKAMAITMAIINGAQAVMQGIAQFGPPPSPAGIAAIAAAVGITGFQVGTIAAAKFAKGGHTAPMDSFANGGPVNRPRLGLIGEAGPEWVAPNWMLKNPATANVIGMLEDMRVNKRQYAMGGPTESKTSMPAFAPANNTQAPAADPEMKQLLRLLLQRLNEPIVAETYIGNRKVKELDDATQRLRQTQAKGKVS